MEEQLTAGQAKAAMLRRINSIQREFQELQKDLCRSVVNANGLVVMKEIDGALRKVEKVQMSLQELVI